MCNQKRAVFRKNRDRKNNKKNKKIKNCKQEILTIEPEIIPTAFYFELRFFLLKKDPVSVKQDLHIEF